MSSTARCGAERGHLIPLAIPPEPTSSLASDSPNADIGCVVIGRNEGERLRRCLQSVVGQVQHLVYVDSGSTDDSVACATSFGAHVVHLDPSVPFTAAGARDAGYRVLRRICPACRWVQFVDGDSEVAPQWLAQGAAYLRTHPETAIVAGRQRERDAQRTPYHRLLDIEWDTPRGIVSSCAGNAMMRMSAYEQCGGFRKDMIAGEEPELCVRVRRAGFQIEALDLPMAVHDAGDVGFCQWWRRSMRAGHAMAEATRLHGFAPERHRVRESIRTVFWALILPLLALGAAPFTSGLSLLALPVGYAITAMRSCLHVRSRGRSWRDARTAAALFTLGKFAELCGMARYYGRRLLRRRPTLIEYKRA